MNYSPLLFLGILATFCASWLGLVHAPYRQLQHLAVNVNTNTGVRYPQMRPGEAQQGAEIYRSLGCQQCHTLQVRPERFCSDMARGWGQRRSVARDYLFDQPVMVGAMRLGPDLANYGERMPTNGTPLLHIYRPQAVVSNSLCPPNPFLFSERRVSNAGASPAALILPKGFELEPETEVVPLPEARQLLEFLRSLRTSVELPEAMLPKAEESVVVAAPSPSTLPPATEK